MKVFEFEITYYQSFSDLQNFLSNSNLDIYNIITYNLSSLGNDTFKVNFQAESEYVAAIWTSRLIAEGLNVKYPKLL